jgi:hypothetical protein
MSEMTHNGRLGFLVSSLKTQSDTTAVASITLALQEQCAGKRNVDVLVAIAVLVAKVARIATEDGCDSSDFVDAIYVASAQILDVLNAQDERAKAVMQ